VLGPDRAKAWTILNFIKNIAIDQNIPVLYISTEQTWKDEMSRLLSIVARMREDWIVKGTFALEPALGTADGGCGS